MLGVDDGKGRQGKDKQNDQDPSSSCLLKPLFLLAGLSFFSSIISSLEIESGFPCAVCYRLNASGIDIAAEAIEKANAQAKKNMRKVALQGTSIPHTVLGTFGRGSVLMMPAF